MGSTLRRDARLTIRVTNDEYAAIVRAAQLASRPLSEFGQAVLVLAAKRRLAQAAQEEVGGERD